MRQDVKITNKKLFLFLVFFFFTSPIFAWQAGMAFKRVLPPRSLTYTSVSPSYPKWTAITNNTPTWSGHAVTSWSISPALPAGLSFSTTTGVISGTPSDLAGSGSYTVTAANAGGSTTVTLNITLTRPNFTWLGTTSSDWATGSNWQGGAAPTTNAHVAIFDNECGANCNVTIGSAVTARSIQMKSNYTGTITQSTGAGNTISLGTNSHSTLGGFIIDGGTFIGGNANIRADILDLNVGTFTATSTELRLGYNAAHTSSGYPISLDIGFVFNHNNGTVYLDGQTSSSTERACGTLTMNQTLVLYNLSIDCHDTDSDQSYDSSYFILSGTSSTIQVLNILSTYDGWTTLGTIEFYGTNANFYCDSPTSPDVCAGVITVTYDGSGDESTQLVFKGSSAQTYTFQDGAGGPTFRIENASGVSSASTTGTFTIFALNAVTGTFTAPSSTLQFVGRTKLQSQGSTTGITIGAGGAFAHNNGTVNLSGLSAYSDSRNRFVFSLASNAITFYNLILEIRPNTQAAGRELGYVALPSGTTITILNDYTAKSGRFMESGAGTNPLLIIRGDYYRVCANFSTHDCADEDTWIDKRFDTHGTNIYNDNPGDTECSGCTYTFNPGAGNTVTINTGVMNLRSSSTHIVVSSGTLNIAAGGGALLGANLTNNAAITCSAGTFIYYEGTLSGTPGGGNNAACYRTTPVDGIPAAVDWVNFTNTSGSQTFSGLDHEAKLEISVANGVGSPTKQYRVNTGADGAWITINSGTPATWTVMNGHYLEFKVSGTTGDTGIFTIRNLSDSSNIIDTVTGTAP